LPLVWPIPSLKDKNFITRDPKPRPHVPHKWKFGCSDGKGSHIWLQLQNSGNRVILKIRHYNETLVPSPLQAGRQSHDSRLCKNIFLKENDTCQAAPLILTGSQGGTIENHHRLWALSSKGIDYDIDRH
jgi:hypothetical protein